MQDIIHIHVGKCAGGTINSVCHRAGFSIRELHCSPANSQLLAELASDCGDNIYLMSVRDPVSRFVSAFNFDKYEKIVVQNSSNELWREVYQKFSSVNHLVESLLSTESSHRDIAWRAVRESFLHMHMGISWYLPVSVLDRIPVDRFNVVRTEFIQSDLSNFLSRFGIDIEDEWIIKDKDRKSFVDSINIPDPDYLSQLSRFILAKVLTDDYVVLDWFYAKGLIDSQYRKPVNESVNMCY
jgi:hypothetical protein